MQRSTRPRADGASRPGFSPPIVSGCIKTVPRAHRELNEEGAIERAPKRGECDYQYCPLRATVRRDPSMLNILSIWHSDDRPLRSSTAHTMPSCLLTMHTRLVTRIDISGWPSPRHTTAARSSHQSRALSRLSESVRVVTYADGVLPQDRALLRSNFAKKDHSTRGCLARLNMVHDHKWRNLYQKFEVFGTECQRRAALCTTLGDNP